jgi:hypothetical protein
LQLMEQAGSWPDVVKVRWALAQVNLHLGDVDEAERWLALAECDGIDHGFGMSSFDTGIRAEIQLTRGDVPAGLRLWRRAVDQAQGDGAFYRNEVTGLEPWALEIEAAAVAAHATHGVLEPVRDLADGLPGKLRTMLRNPGAHPPSLTPEPALCGAVLLAIALVELDRAGRTGDRAATSRVARMIALAERFRFARGFHPTMAPARIRQVAEQADRAAYEEAVSSYAALAEDDLRAVALDYLAGDGSRL